MNRPESPQPVTLTEAFIPIASLVVLVGLSYFLFGDAGASGPNQVGLTVAAMIAVFIGWRRGHSCFARRGRGSECQHRHPAIFILFAVGALIPWNSCGAYMAATLDVATLSHAPYAVFCFASPLLTVAIAWAGILMPRVTRAGAACASAAAQADTARSDE